MQLKLNRPLAFFDLETTGVNIATDRIVEIGIVIMAIDNTEKEYRFLVNPTIPIPVETSVIHGIYDKDVADAKTFAELSKELFDLLDPCDLGGYNSNRFDVPVLVEEFLRVGVDFRIDNRNLLDAFNIFIQHEKRDLSSAYKFFCNKTLENAHTALADVKATFDVFKAQVERYDDLENDMAFIAQASKQNKNAIDNAGRFIFVNKVACFNFGKHKGHPIEKVLKSNPGYYAWMMKSDFPQNTKQVLTELKESFGK